MARALWTGSLSFGLVNVPVALLSAVRDVDLHFHQLHAEDAARIETRRFCAEEGREVPFEAIAHRHEFEDGRSVVVTDEDLAAVAPRRTRTIDIEAFVDLAEIDPVYFDHPYFLAPTGESEGPRRAYQLLVEALRRAERVALGRFVMRTKEYLVAIRERDDRLALTTMRFGDEVRSGEDIDTGGRRPAEAALDQAVALIDALAVDWDPSAYRDCYRARLEDVIERKRAGRRIAPPQREPEPTPVPDLMAALERSLAEARGRGGGGGGRRGGGGGDGGRRGGGSGGDGGGRRRGRGGDDLRALSRDELYARAQEAGVPGRSKMSKDDLVAALSG